MDIQVAVRIRPLVQSELDLGCRPCLEKSPLSPHISVNNGQMVFNYNYVFDELSGNDKVYEEAVGNLIDCLFKGYNVTIMAYGQTGSGKTYTMGTHYDGTGDAGVIPRGIYDIFGKIERDPAHIYEVSVSFLEIYNETLNDLLAKRTVHVREWNDDSFDTHLKKVHVFSPAQTLQLLQEASVARVTFATNGHIQSSRSHAVFTVNVEKNPKEGLKNAITKSKFHFVDLAGSERCISTGTYGDRFKEGIYINKGLFFLGHVISQLEDGKSHVNYRDSKLTRVLKDSLGGNSVTLMIACVSPADNNQAETVSTLRYANRLKQIKNKATINQDPELVEIYSLTKERECLLLEAIESSSSGCPPEHQSLHLKVNDVSQITFDLAIILELLLDMNLAQHIQSLKIENHTEIVHRTLNELDDLINSPMAHCVSKLKTKITEIKEETCRSEKELRTWNKRVSKKTYRVIQGYPFAIQEKDRILLNNEIAYDLKILAYANKELFNKYEVVEMLKKHIEQPFDKEKKKTATKGGLAKLGKIISGINSPKKVNLLRDQLKISQRLQELTTEIQELNKLKMVSICGMASTCQRSEDHKALEVEYNQEQNSLKRKSDVEADVKTCIYDFIQHRKEGIIKRTELSVVDQLKEEINEELMMLDLVPKAQHSLDTLIQERATLTEEFHFLNESLANAPLQKKCKMEERMQQIKDDLDLKSAQISYLQLSIMDSNQETGGATSRRVDFHECKIYTKDGIKELLNFMYEKLSKLTTEVEKKSLECDQLKELYGAMTHATDGLEHEIQVKTEEGKESLKQMEKEYREEVYLLMKNIYPNKFMLPSTLEALVKENEQLKAQLRNMQDEEDQYSYLQFTDNDETLYGGCMNETTICGMSQDVSTSVADDISS